MRDTINIPILNQAPIVVLPSAPGIDDIELGGMMPTSVTTAVMHDGGVRSYNGLRIERFGRGLCASLPNVEDGGNGVGAVHVLAKLGAPFLAVAHLAHSCLPHPSEYPPQTCMSHNTLQREYSSTRPSWQPSLFPPAKRRPHSHAESAHRQTTLSCAVGPTEGRVREGKYTESMRS